MSLFDESIAMEELECSYFKNYVTEIEVRGHSDKQDISANIEKLMAFAKILFVSLYIVKTSQLHLVILFYGNGVNFIQ